MKRIFRWFRKEEGQSGYLFAAAAVVMLAVAGTVIDFGRPSFEARRMQNAADSAALAAVYCLPVKTTDSDSTIRQVAEDYAAKNGYDDPSQVEVTLGNLSDGAYHKVTVTIHNVVEYTLAKMMGYNEKELYRSASVMLDGVSGVKDSVPIAIKRDAFEANLAAGQYDMTLKFGGGGGTAGDYGAVDPDGHNGGGANDYEDRLRDGYSGVLSVNDTILVESGNMSGPTQRAIADRWGRCDHGCTPEHYDPDCPRIMLVPIVEDLGKGVLKIVGFAPFLLMSEHVGSGNKCEVQGTYIPGMILENAESTGTIGYDYGIYTTRIVE